MTDFDKQVRFVKMFDKIRECEVTLTELAMMKPKDYVFEGEELFWVERGEDDYGWAHYKKSVAAKIVRANWLKGKQKDDHAQEKG
jgi:hypothetical protein